MTGTATFAFRHLPSPIGRLTLVAGDDGLAAILWENDRPGRVRLGPLVPKPDHPVLRETERQLRAYFGKELTAFDVPLSFTGTDFQKQVWRALLTIPYGEVRSYSDIARQIGNPAAVRAVGAANGRNPISIIAPCHRVVGMDGTLTGFAGGLEAKDYLLTLEGRRPARRAPVTGDLFAAGG
ncbi:methylated-DNA--[protein]-cysteine S-methyltransferase [Nitrospirillum sp. BR 11164]|uniref:methylated-DNA--[protein]-cysteine S-methyltransferase n=1 Tax=Nitrospirillum sp. BR 11164 TaxID=3104324 RepID=UPI002AFF7D7D|nr:methylated-DNA--[protein]-cysteine S-methyltransferase [Nitrospirillum sp. BR 11164]MEA1652161.1 methylated-DNA--[protein]-cysteine S-methyltransferase [Nitrospirillum sp. BR 11164]